MPIIKNDDGSSTISGKEYDQLHALQKQIEKKESILGIVKEIDSENLKIILDWHLPYITDDLHNTDYLKPVHIAAKYGNLIATIELAALGVTFNTFSGSYGESPLHFAAEYNHPEIIEYLVKGKHLPIDITTKKTDYYDSKAVTPLFKCAVRGSIAAATRLISLGANANYQDSKGSTPLHYACEYGFFWEKPEVVFQFISMLLEKGADPTLKGHDNLGYIKTPIEMINKNEDRIKMQQLQNKFYPKQISLIPMFKREDKAPESTSNSEPKMEIDKSFARPGQ